MNTTENCDIHQNNECDCIGQCKYNSKTTTEDAVEKKENEHYNFTEEDIDSCWIYYKSYFIDVLNGEYSLQEARSDLKGLIGSEYDARTKK